MNRKLRNKLPIAQRSLVGTKIKRNVVHSKLINKQNVFKSYYDKKAKEQSLLKVNQNVTIRKGDSWVPAIIVKICKEPRSYLIRNDKGQMLRRNSNHIRRSSIKPIVSPNNVLSDDDDDENTLDDDCESVLDNGKSNTDEGDSSRCEEESEDNAGNSHISVNDANGATRPKRSTRMPGRFNDFFYLL
ncbi:hypothetical protein ALC62_09697 [Cyphomyrmex costatus]|uniref:Uncharacterized protein n=1 Tax=Cyphomyrmex costatus TaxID=456900 RepID=A0A151IFM9_9HYME|nr:hypothetical protein ALC62_09697 [Cyphomyrmex costatus]